jgi:hypothetical protein
MVWCLAGMRPASTSALPLLRTDKVRPRAGQNVMTRAHRPAGCSVRHFANRTRRCSCKSNRVKAYVSMEHSTAERMFLESRGSVKPASWAGWKKRCREARRLFRAGAGTRRVFKRPHFAPIRPQPRPFRGRCPRTSFARHPPRPRLGLQDVPSARAPLPRLRAVAPGLPHRRNPQARLRSPVGIDT